MAKIPMGQGGANSCLGHIRSMSRQCWRPLTVPLLLLYADVATAAATVAPAHPALPAKPDWNLKSLSMPPLTPLRRRYASMSWQL